MMRLKIALLLTLLVPLGTAKADVVTLSNSVSTTDPIPTTTAGSLFIKFTTSGTGAFSLGALTLFGSPTNDIVSYALKNSAGATINSIAGTDVTMAGRVLTLNSNLFGEGTYWLEIINLASTYNQGASATLTGGASNVSNGLLETGLNTGSSASGVSLFQASLTVSVPEPATMILTGSALAAGAIGAYFKRRRKPQTEIAA